MQHDDIIKLSHSIHIDRLQFTIDNRDVGIVLNQLHSMFEYFRPIKDGRKFIHQFKQNHSLIELALWNGSFKSAVIVHDPDDEIQLMILEIMQICPLKLSQVEIAFDFMPDNERDIRDLRRVLTDGIVLRNSRVNCYSRYLTTEYIGKNGNVRHGSKGIRVYEKRQNGERFLRMELQFNRPGIKRNRLSLPIDAYKINLIDYLGYRQLDTLKLLDILCKKWRRPVKNVSDLAMTRGLERAMILSWVSCIITDGQENPVSEQISRFKYHLKGEKLGHRFNEFFFKSPKMAMIFEDVQMGFVRRRY